MLITNAGPEWTSCVASLSPGAHVAVFADGHADLIGVAGRLVGLELRDTLGVFRAGPRLSLILLFRKPIHEPSLAAQVLATGTGALNLSACRVESAEVITTHSRGHTTAHPATRDKSIEDAGDPFYAIHFYNGNGLHSTVTGGEKEVRGKAMEHSAGFAELLYSSIPLAGWPRGRRQQDILDQNERSSRWPPNILLVHDTTCSEDTCEDTCPVKCLDEQSGERFVSGTARGRTLHHNTSMGYHGGGSGADSYLPCDDGGASRFYPQFKNEAELREWVERLITPMGSAG